MKKIKLALLAFLSICTIAVQASDLEYFVSGIFEKGDHLFSQSDLPSDFLDKDYVIEKEFEITQSTEKVNGRYMVYFFNDIEHAPKKKIVVSLYKLNPKTKNYEAINKNFYFLENTKFWFAGLSFLSPKEYLSIGISHKKYFDKN